MTDKPIPKPESPQKVQPLIDPSLPRDPKTGRILNDKGQPVGSSEPRFYDSMSLDNDHARLFQLEEQINAWRSSGDLWNDWDEDGEVTQAIAEYEEIQKRIHPQLSDPLSFHGEWDDEVKEEGYDKTRKEALEKGATDAREAGLL